jgi:hypothetical protein
MMGLRIAGVCPIGRGLAFWNWFPRTIFTAIYKRFWITRGVYDVVRESYAIAGRPSIDPMVFFKLQLVMFFEDIRSERLLMRLVADRLSVRW